MPSTGPRSVERRTLGSSGVQAPVVGMGTWKTFDIPSTGPRSVERRTLGSSGVQAPVVGMGTWKTFDIEPAEERRPVLEAALAEGGNLFDSSPMYGRAEKVLGELVRGRRDQVLIATKVWTPDDREAERQVERALAFYDGLVD